MCKYPYKTDIYDIYDICDTKIYACAWHGWMFVGLLDDSIPMLHLNSQTSASSIMPDKQQQQIGFRETSPTPQQQQQLARIDTGDDSIDLNLNNNDKNNNNNNNNDKTIVPEPLQLMEEDTLAGNIKLGMSRDGGGVGGISTTSVGGSVGVGGGLMSLSRNSDNILSVNENREFKEYILKEKNRMEKEKIDKMERDKKEKEWIKKEREKENRRLLKYNISQLTLFLQWLEEWIINDIANASLFYDETGVKTAVNNHSKHGGGKQNNNNNNNDVFINDNNYLNQCLKNLANACNLNVQFVESYIAEMYRELIDNKL